MSNSATELTKEVKLRLAARRYLADKIYQYLLGKSQAAKLRQVLKGVDIEGANVRLIKDVMTEIDRFETVDRRWAVSARFGDSQRPFERILRDILLNIGVPSAIEPLAEELAQIYNRSVEYYEKGLERVFADKNKFFATGSGTYGLTDWLLIPTTDEEADIIFDNFLSEAQVAEFSELCPAVEWDIDNIADTAVKVVKDCDEAIPVKILALLAWRSLGEDFDAIDFYNAVLTDDRLMILSDQRVYLGEIVEDVNRAITKMSDELAALPMEADEEEAEGPITLTDTDKEEIISLIIEKGSASAEELLETVLEVSPEESAFAGALESLLESLKEDERIMWLGGTRWGKIETFPDEVTEVPASLVVPEVAPFETPEGDVYDLELEIDGFEGDLKSAIYDPLAEDVTDEDPSHTMYQANGDSQRCVLKYHHKIEGTFPMCQINPDFFGIEPEIIPIVLIDEGKRKTVYVNNTTRLIYGLKDFYKEITEVSGAVFYIEKTAKPGEYRFKFDGEMDDQLGIDTNRSLELLDLRARFESQDMPLYDVITEILEKHGMTFPQLVTQVNIVKRCSRLIVASILSSYHAFSTRSKSGVWQFDSKKASQGFNKTKKKYVKKD